MKNNKIIKPPKELHYRVRKLWRAIYKKWINKNEFDEETFYAACLALSSYYDLMKKINEQGFMVVSKTGIAKKNPLLVEANNMLRSYLACTRALKIQSGVRKKPGKPSQYEV